MVMKAVLAILFTLLKAHYAECVFCFELGGNFDPDPPFQDLPEPYCPDDLGADLKLLQYTWSNLNVGDVIDDNTIPANFDPSNPTVFIVHGWTNDIDTLWLQPLKDAHLSQENMNVILVGWGGDFGAGNIIYSEAASTTRTIGAYVGEVIANLVEEGGANPLTIQCVGHSLGAHLCGHAGRWASVEHGLTLGRVTGLDPAGPLFSSSPDRTIGIWTDTASLVDCIHTDGTLGSTPLPLCHQDFYPNDGRDQPGCETDTCSHARVLNIYEDSLDSADACYNTDERCVDAGALPNFCSSCGGYCARMGYHVDPLVDDGIFRLTMNADTPWC